MKYMLMSLYKDGMRSVQYFYTVKKAIQVKASILDSEKDIKVVIASTWTLTIADKEAYNTTDKYKWLDITYDTI